MNIERACSNCQKCIEIKKGDSFRHRYGMIAVNFGPAFLLRTCSTEKETTLSFEEKCDKPDEFVENLEKIV